jgi:membrane fusion protein (multidrug efflux system)
MKKKNRLHPGFVAFAMAVLIFPACKREDAAKTPPPPPSVLVLAAATRDVPVFREWLGTLDGSENADIRARVTGHLMKRDYQEGSLVKKGDVLFQIDPRPFESALAQAQSQLEEGKAAQLASAAEADRSKNLFTQKAITEREFVNKTQMNESSKAKVGALEASLETARLNLEFCRITSPVTGIAGVSNAQVGDLVGTPNSAVLTQVSTLDPMKIIFPVSEADYLAASKNVQETLNKPLDQRAERMELILADGSTFPHKARLLAVDRQVKASTGTILVTALLANPGSVLRPGFFARARVEADVLKDAVVVPQRAVSEVQGSYQVGVVGADGKAEIRPVKVGPRAGTDWVITSGLKAGEKVVVEGLQKIRSGMPVSAKPWVPPAEKPAPPPAEAKPEAKPEAK